MNRAIATRSLKKHARAIKGMGATALYLFRSAARDERRSSSDLDLFVDYGPAKTFSLLEQIGIKQFLEEKLAVEVDITIRNSLHPMHHGRCTPVRAANEAQDANAINVRRKVKAT